MSNGTKPPGWNQKPPVAIPKSEIGGSSRGRVNLKAEDFDNLVKDQGVRVKIYRTMLCPNVKSIDGGEHNIDCEICQGNGFVDLRPIDSMAVIQNQELNKVHRAEGYWDGNSVAATFLQGIELQYFTLIKLPDYTDVFFERIKRQQGPVDRLKYKATCINVVMDSSGIEYFEGNDFSLDANGSIRWKTNKGPGPGVIYSIHYEMCIQYRAIKAMHVNRFIQDAKASADATFRKMNEQWMLQREYLVKRTDFNGKELDANLIRDPDEE